MFAIAATSGIAIYQWYLAQDGLGDVSQVAMFGLSGAAAVMSVMAVAAFVGSLLAALLLGRIARAFKDSRIPAIAACLLFVVAVVLPLTPIDRAMAVALYALFAGFAYVVYDGVSQGLNLATLPDVRSVGRSFGRVQFGEYVRFVDWRCRLRDCDCGDWRVSADFRCCRRLHGYCGRADVAAEMIWMI
ncbi:MAG: hypothetical protein V9G11_00050 [Bifidobacterium adolescentis]